MKLIGDVYIPGDKSISHRAIMLNSIAYGKAHINHFLFSDDCLTTIEIFRQLGVKILVHDDSVTVYGNGFLGLQKPSGVLNCNNSGTTARLLLGLLAGLSFESELTGDESLIKRPMKRVTKLLSLLNGKVQLTNDDYLPVKILPSEIVNNYIQMDVSSAQVKSALLLCALKNHEETIIVEKHNTRDHTERMLAYMNADIETNGLEIKITGKNKLHARDIYVPGDISSAAFFIVAALIIKDSCVTIKNCGLNETRAGILQVLDLIHADYEIRNRKSVCNEDMGDLVVRYTENLKPFLIEGELIPLLIDELPVLALLATQIKGESIIRDAKELRVKESDRIHATVTELNKCGAKLESWEDGIKITGKTTLKGTTVQTYHDHRISMMLKVARLMCDDIVINDAKIDKISYPNFEKDLNNLKK